MAEEGREPQQVDSQEGIGADGAVDSGGGAYVKDGYIFFGERVATPDELLGEIKYRLFKITILSDHLLQHLNDNNKLLTISTRIVETISGLAGNSEKYRDESIDFFSYNIIMSSRCLGPTP